MRWEIFHGLKFEVSWKIIRIYLMRGEKEIKQHSDLLKVFRASANSSKSFKTVIKVLIEGFIHTYPLAVG